MATSKEISFRQIGQNVKLVIDGETYTRKVEEKEEREIIKSRVISYNAKPLVKEKKSIISLMSIAKKEAQANKSKEVKGINIAKNTAKPSKKAKEVLEAAPELSKEEQITAAKKLLEENNYTVDAKRPSSSSTPSRYRSGGEY